MKPFRVWWWLVLHVVFVNWLIEQAAQGLDWWNLLREGTRQLLGGTLAVALTGLGVLLRWLYQRRQKKRTAKRIQAEKQNARQESNAPTDWQARMRERFERQRERDALPQLAGTFRWKGGTLLLEFVNKGGAGDFWATVSTHGMTTNLVSARCARVEEKSSWPYVPHGGTFTIKVLKRDTSMARGLVGWRVLFVKTDQAHIIQEHHSTAFGPPDVEKPAFDIVIEIASKPDMYDGVLRKRLRVHGHETNEIPDSSQRVT